MKILVVDDIAQNRKLVRAQLEAEQIEVAEAADGVEALHVLAREKFDAVISDILMPRMDGYRLCHEIRRNEQLRELRFVLYSSTYTSPTDVKLSATVGADHFIAKPAPVQTILDAVRIASTSPPARPAIVPEEAYVLKEYSATLVTKLEEKNAELQIALAELQRAHDRIVELNAGLERRVAERTVELETANRDLTTALAEVKQLSGLLPICSYCKKMRDDKNYWDSVEGYLSRHTDVRLSHGVCPGCYEVHIVPMLAELERSSAPGPE
jgi:CheY-like chemotaxis protein